MYVICNPYRKYSKYIHLARIYSYLLENIVNFWALKAKANIGRKNENQMSAGQEKVVAQTRK